MQRRSKHIPQRTCVACRQKVEKRRLTRIVKTPDAGVVVDPTGKRNGRGAYLCDRPTCWDKVLTYIHLLNQALLTEVTDQERVAIAAHAPKPTSVTNVSPPE